MTSSARQVGSVRAVARGGVILASVMMLAACSGASSSTPKDRPAAGAQSGYLARSQVLALAEATPNPPAPGSPQAQSDQAQSDRLRAFEDTPRWMQAISHAELRPPVALQHFQCALGARFDPIVTPEGAQAANTTPALNRMATRLFLDAEAASEQAKTRGHRPRPVGIDSDRRACQTISAAGRASASHPSGSSAVAAAYGALLAEAAPDRAQAVRAVVEQISLSRQICAMHYPSDTSDGEALGRAVFAAARQSAEFQADLGTARTELAAVRSKAAANEDAGPSCAAERAPSPRP